MKIDKLIEILEDNNIQIWTEHVRYLAAKEPVSEFYDKEKNIMYWRELCLGEFTVTEIEGNHYTCIETEPNALKLADVIGKSS